MAMLNNSPSLKKQSTQADDQHIQHTPHVAILGGGAVGLTLGLRLALAGVQVTIIEKEASPGGLAAGFPIGNVTLEKFYHHLFKTDVEIVELINSVGLGDDLIWLNPNTSTLYQGKIHRLDSAKSVLRFSPLPCIDRIRMGAVIALLKIWPNHQFFEQFTAEEFLQRWMGKKAYDVAWRPLFDGKFGSFAATISLAWFWARIHCRTPYLGYLKGGFQRLYDRLATLIVSLNGTINFGTTVSAIREGKNGILTVETTQGTIEADFVVSTLPTHVTLQLAPTMPSFLRKYDRVDAIGAHCAILALDRQFMPDVYWLNIADPEYPFLAVVEHTNFMPMADYGGRHLLYMGNYLPMDHPIYTMSKEDVLVAYIPALQRINPQFDPTWIRDSWIFAAPYAQPIVTPDFSQHIPPHQTPIPNLLLANMFQVYPQDRGQNYAVAMANRLASDLLARVKR